MLAALTLIATMVVTVPTAGGGYVNIGDSIVILSGWLLGGVYGPLAAGIGSAMADIFSGYAFYAPATFAIKALMAFVVGMNARMFKGSANRTIPLAISAVLAELIMLAGYFLFEAALLGVGPASLSVAGNAVQGLICLVLGNVLIPIVSKIKIVRDIRIDF